MKFRIAVVQDLPQLKEVFSAIVQNMNENGVPIWDEVYPCEFFADDIENGFLYILEDKGTIVSAFSLSAKNEGADFIAWENKEAKAMYIDRFGVNICYSKKGIGTRMLQQAVELAKEKGASYLRLFVVDCNRPAITLYLKNGFKQAEGVYCEMLDDGSSLREFGFEKQIEVK